MHDFEAGSVAELKRLAVVFILVYIALTHRYV
eukprot:COSAG03_NODE_20048_length_325_cov_0.911504_1_plen_31_part_01